MEQGNPPVYQLVDDLGNVQAEIRHDLAQSLIIDQLNGSDIDFQQSDLSNITSLSAEQATIGPVTEATTNITWDRPEILKSDTTVQVPQDEPTIQDALRKVPKKFFADYTIQVDKSQGPYNEDIIIPPYETEGLGATNASRLVIEDQGSVSDGSNGIEVNSVTNIGGRGLTVIIQFKVTDTSPYIDENAAWASLQGGELLLTDCAVGGTDRGTDPDNPTSAILCFASNVKLQNNFDFGTDLFQRGIFIKRGNRVTIDASNTITGSVKEEAAFVISGEVSHSGRLPSAPTDVNNLSNATSGVRLRMTDRSGNVEDHVFVDSNGNKRFYHPNGTEMLMFNGGLNQTLFKNYEPRVFSGDGDGIIVTTPDGSDEYRMRVDNNGNIVTDGPL